MDFREVSALKRRALFYVNFAVVLFGFAGLFGKWIDLPSVEISFGRVLFSSITLAVFMLITKRPFKLRSRRDLYTLMLGGLILAMHWWSIFESIRISSVAIGTITFSSFPLFLTFIEPAVTKDKISRKNVIIALIILVGVVIAIPEFSLENNVFKGVLIGLISPIAYSVLTIINKNLTENYESTLISFYEQSSAAVVLFPLALILGGVVPGPKEIGLLLIFAVVTTALAHTLFIACLPYIPAQLAGICSSMETVYGILFAALFLGEIPTWREITGGLIILAAVLYAQLSEKKEVSS